MRAIKLLPKRLAAVLLGLAGCGPLARANPPAPYHLVYGTARDQYGDPLTATNASVILQGPGGVQLSVRVVPGLAAGVNYQIEVPMDDGVSLPLYRPDALTASSAFTMLIAVGSVTNVPIEMTTNTVLIGAPGGNTRLDLTQGVDANHDGIPDAWEYAYLATLGLNLPLSSLNANSRLAPDGHTLLQDYLLGLPVFDPGVSLQVTLTGFSNSLPVLEFTGMSGRSYNVLGSADLVHWSALSFRLAGDAPGAPARSFYYSSTIQTLQMQVIVPPPATAATYLKVQLQ